MVDVDSHTLRVLEFDKVLEMASVHALTTAGRKVVLQLGPLGSADASLQRMRLISACRRLKNEGFDFGIEYFDELDTLFRRLRPEEAVLEPLELRGVLPLLRSAINLRRLLKEAPATELNQILERLHTHPELMREIERSIEPDGRIADEASAELFDIRQRIRALDRRIKSVLERILNDKSLRPHIQDFYITERNGRRVIPVKSDSKGHIRGVIHDISNTGETVFVEPNETLQMGNELESLKAEERVEEFRVLKRLSALLRDVLSELQEDYERVVMVDMLQSLASFAEQMQMIPPEINRSGYIKIVKGRHPLLWKSLKEGGRLQELVPLDFELRKPYRGMVITGSNTGGKTVALKTVGVLQLMTLTGMHLPAAEGTTFPFVERVIADIGDEQSIEQSLSTFSAHVMRLKEVLERSDSSTLVIIDELGTGTDPDEGGALGCALLNRLVQRGALVVVSTHLGLLKAYAYKHPQLINGAMQIETKRVNGRTLFWPTYRLQIGEPGQSYALHIAERFGMPEDLIEEAKEMIRDKASLLEEVLQELRQTQQRIDKKLRAVEKTEKELKQLKEKLNQEIERIKHLKSKILQETHRKAEEILRSTRREAEELLRRIRAQQRQEAKVSLKELERRLRYHADKGGSLKERSPKKVSRPKIGQSVLIGGFGIVGVVTEVIPSTGRCRVDAGGKEIEVSIDNLFEPEASKTEDVVSIAPDTLLREPPSSELNVIGMRVEDALREVERYLNDAALGGLEEVRIIHGVGSGRLKGAIREYLDKHPLVQEFSVASAEQGGEGVTIVKIK
jgi:DNA mismatch repair protein MutS2